MGPKPIRTNRDFLKGLFQKGMQAIPELPSDTPLGEFAEHVRKSTLESLDEGPPTDRDPNVIEVSGEEVK